jgi:proline-rich protein PRCC
MDSLLATYASSDDEEDSPQQIQQHSKPSNKSDSSSRFTGNSIENPKSSSFFSSLQPPKSQDKSSSSLFSVLPQPKSKLNSSSANPNPRKIVQIKPRLDPSFYKDDDDDDALEEKRRKARKAESLNQTATVKSFLSSIPAPKNSSSLGALPNSSGTARRSILEADVTPSNSNSTANANSVSKVNETVVDSNIDNTSSVDYTVNNTDLAREHYANYDTYGSYSDSTNLALASEANANFESYGSYGDASNLGAASEANANIQSYGNNEQHYQNNWVDPPRTTTDMPVNFSGKRGRTDIPHKIIEVKQDELIKNRPREDQTKLTGIAFGPSYQPTSTKGKPSKLHKRKHQIGTLYFEMRQKETELAERRSKGFLTKAETQAKYGW